MRRTPFFIASSVLALTLFAGCSGNQSATDAGSTTSAAGVTSTADSTSTALIGTWKYDAATVENQVPGNNAVAATIKQGVASKRLKINSDGTFAQSVGAASATGHWTLDSGTKQVKFEFDTNQAPAGAAQSGPSTTFTALLSDGKLLIDAAPGTPADQAKMVMIKDE